jgi:acetylornithine deacetylase/succinyl-diaminopimelate desuccinylase-like protein
LIHDLRLLVESGGSSEQATQFSAVVDQISALMRRCGLQTEQIGGEEPTIVVGRRTGRSPFTLLLYHYYDITPTGPWRSWNHHPFQLAERDGWLYGRGVAAGRGPLVAHLHAIQALLKSDSELPCNVVVLVEGQAHQGSPQLRDALTNNLHGLHADACLIIAGERDAHGVPLCYGGAKGLLQVRLKANGANQALPPGFASSIANPLWQLIGALAQIKSDQEEILITDFYNDIVGPSREENARLKSVELDEDGRRMAWGINQFIFGMTGTALIRAEATLPVCNLSTIQIEPSGNVALIPSSASARLDFHLVPNQVPTRIFALLQAHLQAKGLGDLEVEQLPGGYTAAHTSLDHSFAASVQAVVATIFGKPAQWMPIGPFALPAELLHQHSNAPIISVGCARPDSATHGPNENLPIDDLLDLGRFLINLLQRCANNDLQS